MRRLTRYLARLFATDALILFVVMCFLLWLVNCLRAFDVVSDKGQGFGTLAFQSLLALPPLALSFLYLCVGIGVARALQALQASYELHIIHTSHGLGSLWRASWIVAVVGMVLALILSNFLEPYANRRLYTLRGDIAADLVSTTLKPERFTQVTPGVVLWIGGRSGQGEIDQFFADDRRDATRRRTYIAESAKVSAAGESYVVELRNGALQYLEPDGRFSEISFTRYDLNVDQLSQPNEPSQRRSATDSVTLAMTALQNNAWTPELTTYLVNRFAEGLRVIGICLVVLAMSAFPSGRRVRVQLPMEAVVLFVGFAERGLSTYSPMGPVTGAIALIVGGGVALLWRARPRRSQAVPA